MGGGGFYDPRDSSLEMGSGLKSVVAETFFHRFEGAGVWFGPFFSQCHKRRRPGPPLKNLWICRGPAQT